VKEQDELKFAETFNLITQLFTFQDFDPDMFAKPLDEPLHIIGVELYRKLLFCVLEPNEELEQLFVTHR
jgi:hypothetical protein